MYDQYRGLLSGEADVEKDLFLKSARSEGGGVLAAFKTNMDGYDALATKVFSKQRHSKLATLYY